ncbi:14959_t:CDS:2 [Cetraspora pellucida]|uniref:14959_t:CDS:1 n=1 Tax=Cetraspora pellucida TaxID=1433469 RepID=A0ACA9JY64_9GLOM|nr:14959_t:CDS:2 [Cetraspora pellucida]
MAEIILYCFILGNSLEDVFPVIIGEKTRVNNNYVSINNFTVGVFKNLLIEMKGKQLVSNLNIWKVEDVTKGSEKWKILEQQSYTEIDIEKQLGGEKLGSSIDTIKEIFPQNPPIGIHLIIQLLRKRQGDFNEDDADRAKKEKLMHLRQQDKTMLENLIKQLPKIDTSHYVFTIPQFPGTDGDSIIYNRKCYTYFRDFIFGDRDFMRYCIIGNPGIGKTYFGRLMLVDLLKQGQSVLIDCQGCTLFISPKGELYKVETSEYREFASLPNTWCIIDGKEPQVSHDFSRTKLIMVSSPKKEIVERFIKAQQSKLFYMPTWSEDEVFDCYDHLYKEKITQESLKNKFELCGGIARWIFDIMMPLEEIKQTIDSASTSINPRLIEFQGRPILGDELTHKLIHIHTNLPSDYGEIRDPYKDAICLFASQYVTDKCLDRLKQYHREALYTFIESAKDISEMRGLRGQLFETISHAIICKGGSFRVRKLLDKGSSYEEIHSFKPLEENFFNCVEEIKKDEKYYRPTSKNFESIDSYVHPNKLFQITIAKRHSIKPDGLRMIKGILDESRKINFYFVLPKDIFAKFTKKQAYENKRGEKVFDAWIYEIDQYALCLDLNQYSI